MSTSLSSISALVLPVPSSNVLSAETVSLPKKDGSNGVFVKGSSSADSAPHGGSI